MILAVIIVAALVFLYVAVCGYLYTIQERFIFVPEKLAPDFAFDLPSNCTELTLNTHGARLNALYFQAETPRGVVLYLHGNGGSLRTWGGVAEPFLKAQLDVYIFDYRGYGKSTGSITSEAQLLSDVSHAYAYVCGRYAESKILVYGCSLGTGLATYIASLHRPCQLILEMPYFSMVDLAQRRMPFFPMRFLKYTLRTDRWISKVRCPIYLFHGDRDELIPYTSSQRLLPLIRARHRLFTIPGAGHNDLRSFDEFRQGLDTVLASEALSQR